MNKKTTIGPIMIDIEGYSLNHYEKDKIAHPNIGGVILFARNYHDRKQITALTHEIKLARNGPILITVDQEGGRVQRFQEEFTRLPPAQSYLENPACTLTAGWIMASELLAVGVDFSFAPVLDVDCGISTIIGDRSFSPSPEQTAALASNFRRGMNQAGMAAVGKHFPGHGAVALDSHLTLPVDERPFEELLHKDLIPFKRLISEGLEGIMPAHVVYPEIDNLSAGFSSYWIKNILRKQLGFKGVIFSDDLSMEGAASVGDFRERSQLALSAGCDMLLVCNNAEAADQVLESIPIENNIQREQRLMLMLGNPSNQINELYNSTRWQQAAHQLKILSNA